MSQQASVASTNANWVKLLGNASLATVNTVVPRKSLHIGITDSWNCKCHHMATNMVTLSSDSKAREGKLTTPRDSSDLRGINQGDHVSGQMRIQILKRLEGRERQRADVGDGVAVQHPAMP